MYKMFIDDERFPPKDGEDWKIARNLKEVQNLVLTQGMPSFISFDHDLGEDEPTGYDVTKWLIEKELDGEITFPSGFSFYVHSQNPIGKVNIEGLLNRYLEVINR